MNLSIVKLASSIDDCNKHLKIIFSDYVELEKIMPLTLKSFGNLNDDRARILDQFIFRSSKLQDAIFQQLFPALLLSIEEEERPYKNILNRIETLGKFISKEEWFFLIKLRNQLLHECSNKIIGNVESINSLFENVKLIYLTFINIKNYSFDKFEYFKGKCKIFHTPVFPGR
jgi:hypothetical protein